MKVERLSQAWFNSCPRYLTAERFCQAAGIDGRENHIEILIKQGVLPSRRFGRYLMVDMHELMLRLVPLPDQEEFSQVITGSSLHEPMSPTFG